MTILIEKLVYGGDGLGRDANGRAVFVPYVLPGELVEAGVPEMRGGSAKAQLVGVTSASEQRIEPGCRHFGRCGGCQYQHMSYMAQLAVKSDILSETLERAGLRNRPGVTVHAGEPWWYRNRIRMRVEEVGGAIRVGYNFRETRDFLPIEECPIAAPVLWRTAAALLTLADADAECRRWVGGATEVELFTTDDEGSVQMSLLMGERRTAGFAEFCERVKRAVPELVGAGATGFAEEKGRRREEAGLRWGRGGLEYRAAERVYWVSRGGFFQVNRYLVDELVRVVAEGRRGRLCWDLFAGVGLFSRVLAGRFERVVAVEANAVAMRDLASMKDGKVRTETAPVVEFLRRALVERERPELVVMDPPRAGVGKVACQLLVQLEAPSIVYVSCDPTTLARDLRVMVDSGYDLAELHLVDLFPQTYHLETVAVLQRRTW